MKTMANTDTLLSMYSAFQSGDVDFVISQMDESVEWDRWDNGHPLQEAGYPLIQHRKGPENVRQFFETVPKTIDLKEFEPLPFMTNDDGSVVASPIRMRIKFLDSGNEIVEDVWHIWTFNEEGKVVELRHLLDTAKHLANWKG
jgi:ketosteroid isomerase-like protein